MRPKPPHHRYWATFYCDECDDLFADVIPDITEDLPCCHECGGGTIIFGVLCDQWHTYATREAA